MINFLALLFFFRWHSFTFSGTRVFCRSSKLYFLKLTARLCLKGCLGDFCLLAWMAYFQGRSLSFSREGNLSKKQHLNKNTQKDPLLDTKLVLWKHTTHEWRRHESFKVRSHQTIPQKKPLQVKVEIVPWYPCYHQYTLLFRKNYSVLSLSVSTYHHDQNVITFLTFRSAPS